MAWFARAEAQVQAGVEWLRLGVETLGAVVIAAGVLVTVAGLRHCYHRGMHPSRLPVRVAALVLAAAILPAAALPVAEHIRAPASAFHAQAAQAPADAFTAQVSADGLPYRLLAPVAPPPPGGYPLVLVLHGSGAIGADNAAQMGAFAASWALPAVRAAYPAYVVAPQFPARTADYDAALLNSRAGAPLARGLDLVETLLATLPVDRRRVYVTGFSMGASAAWHALLARPGLFAAAVPVAGIAPPRSTAGDLRATPVLIVHGEADTENPPASSLAMHAALRAAGATQVHLRTYAGLGHAVPADILSGAGWRAWLFAQRRP